MIKTLSDALAERGYDTLTAVQEAVTAPELQDADLLVSAQTGSGKTVGFGLAIAHTLLGDDEHLGPAAAPLALVVAPTRELAFQVMRELGWLYARAGARVTSCVGGMDMREERRALERGAHIVVGTPGRLRDHIQRGSLDLSSLRAIVLDEADEMLDLGFREDLEFMLGEAPAERRTLLFSATVPPMIATLAKQYQRDAVRVTTLSGASQHADIAYQALRVAQNDAENAIINVLRYHEAQNAIVFANTRAAVNRLTARFANRGFAVVSLSGELSQSERTHALQAMRDGRARVCVATDVAARGIDLPNLELVIHADLPTNAEGLLHRSGRTGRAGRKGISALIITPKIAKKAERLLKFAKIEAEWMTAPTAEEILRRDEERLLADPVWDEETTEEQQAFAAKLLDLHSPEKIAAAYLRLYRARQSAPEDLSPPDAQPAPKERKPFGPSVWFALSVGRNDRAEARWLLPLLCRAGNLHKDAIGAIRVQSSETYVELSQDSVSGFLASLGEGGALEEGVTVRQLDGAPDMAPPPRTSAPRKPGARPVHADRDRRAPEPEPCPPVAATKPRPPVTPDATAERPRTGTGPSAGKPRHQKPDRPEKRQWSEAPAAPKRGKPGAAETAKPERTRAERSAGKPDAAKPRKGGAGKFGAGKPAGKPATTRPGAADSSKRVARPGKPEKAKPGAPKGGKRRSGPDGGNTPPRRQKR
ncbi:DEAD/DEAH box helicase [Actibacterium sp. MT2.3-13A]|uniref:DEAD/DEAH box helicase n=1 Tax=Actibacterium sp. MT2.3-13A TaxID=2828332 RepID=UPI001BA6B0E7|nr:DEAD/DEAH box helicase [Actibacterium sp. MT2.3-13A]